MFLKNILKAFDPNTRVEVYLDETLLSYGTVKEIMDSGLMCYATVLEKSLIIKRDTILIELEK